MSAPALPDMSPMAANGEDDHPYRSAVLLGLVVTAGAMVWSLFVWPAIHPIPPYTYWDAPPDVWHVMATAHYVLHGSLFQIYSAGAVTHAGAPTDQFATGQYQAGPLLPILLSPIAFIGERLGLGEWVLRWNPRPTMWLLYGPYAMLLSSIPFLYAIRSLAVAAGIKENLLRLQVVACAFVVVPVVGYYGHFDDVLALTFVVLSARDLSKKEWMRAAIMLGIAVLFKQWAWLALPLLLATTPKGHRLRSLLPSVVAPAAFFALALAKDWHYASLALLKADTCPGCGHAALWVPAHALNYVAGPARAGVLVVAAVVAWRTRGRNDVGSLSRAFAVILIARVFFEPVVYFYQVAAALPFLLIDEELEHTRLWRTSILTVGVMLVFPHYPAVRILWWIPFLCLVIALAWPAIKGTFLARTRSSVAAGDDQDARTARLG